jgi:hypothetical protein
MLVFGVVSTSCLISPPLLLCLAWARFFAACEITRRSKWRNILGAESLTFVSTLLIICIARFLGYGGNADAGDIDMTA